METYYDSAVGVTITHKRALQLILEHNADVAQFLAECGYKDEYLATDVLDWLGY